jgi:Ca2+-binding RTX toxin-like protein
MSKHIITKDRDTQLLIETSNSTWIIDTEATLNVPGHIAILIDGSAHDNNIDIKGDISTKGQQSSAVWAKGDNNTITVEASSKITGTYGVGGEGAGIVLDIAGKIDVTGGAIDTAKSAIISNSGSVLAADGDGIMMSGGTLTNKVAGKIHGGMDGVYLSGSDATHIVNNGTISGPNAINDTGSGDLKITNRGTIHGDVSLGSGEASFDTRHGTVTGTIAGSSGDTTYLVSNASLVIAESASSGNDTVKSTVTYLLGDNIEKLVLIGKADISGTGNDMDNHIVGNSGSNLISGNAGLDVLDGGKGNDVLSGGLDQDTFVFDKGNDVDKIDDFTHGSDYIQIAGFSAIQDYASLSSHITQHGQDTWITFDHGDKLILNGIDHTILTSDDFVFS